MKGIHFVTFILLVIGGLNWLLFGIFNWELGQNLFGGMDSGLSTVVYVLIGLSALYEIFTHKQTCKLCEGMGKGGKK
ncbi:MAG: hypothetical protein A2666_00610 [Parcubacteria group bacterium RIFCSPHIGHO2_01_FULL_47_10b]|nr:MAG: hypothetical protein A2666_00610 [Parcubacteria group bacterium RIFCSPHIGHO2_01_FULL_47_10b]